MYSVRAATTFAVGGPNTGAVGVASWSPDARSWTNRLALDFNATGPRWSIGSGAVVDPISGLVWLLSGQVWSWQPNASTWTDRSSVAMPPMSGSPVFGGVLVFDERRGTLVLLNPTPNVDSHPNVFAVWELALP